MRVASAVLAILVSLACAAIAIFGSWSEGAAPEACGLAVLLLGGAFVALFVRRLRYLAAAWGLFFGIWLVVIEFFVIEPMTSKNVVMQDEVYTIIAVTVVTLVALVGLVFALIAPGRDA